MSEMGHDLDPWAALNLKQHENVTFFSIYTLCFLLLRRQNINYVCFDATLIQLALYLNCEMKLMQRDGSQARLPNSFLLSSTLHINLQDGMF